MKSILCGVGLTLLLIFMGVILKIGITVLSINFILSIAAIFALVLMSGLFSIMFYEEVFNRED